MVEVAGLAVRSALTTVTNGPGLTLSEAAASPLLHRINTLFRDRLKSAVGRGEVRADGSGDGRGEVQGSLLEVPVLRVN
jgi:hypothetical protein